ncbi:L-lysine 6-monooxygenase [Prauserella marina]|uniref:L-lysine N6-monooxygenase MbtG n=1 Tax=Prauserella marina TaxID=530584 RepID=A0A222VJC8_9PSEU|nr:lysine N(6)-hydroxylase/L-ornithine N(5)-oxygenase family protein [Prauserella marina]ASR33932.1 L-lysine 6-monooxygenase [Prauserella marina]PWV82530.1 L-ornithine N5-oxygenase [Prauserella marina]SDC71359.1 L-ornithine N5-oxygenase [Prauserella marina]
MAEGLLAQGTPVYDLIGVGFGPANLALAIAVAEHNATTNDPVTAHFLERQERFGWHRGMLIDDATMQVSFLKDLVTLRNPASDFSFLAYLKAKERLVDFVNHKTLFPLRVEFHDYFEWAAAKVDDMVTYAHEVERVLPVRSAEGEVVFFDVVTPNGETYRARNLVMATGLSPSLPDGIDRSERIWHNSELLHRVGDIGSAERFVVVGAGQSAAEVTAFLHGRFAEAEVCSVFSRFGYSPSDDSAFANRIFDPAAVDEFYAAPDEVKRRLMGYHANTNYSVVDIELIDDLYRRLYREKVLGDNRLRIFNAARLTEVVDTGSGVRATVESLTSGEKTVLDADIAVYATGYRPSDFLSAFGELAPCCRRDDSGRPRVERDYQVRTSDDVVGGIYLQGGNTEHTHGITSSLLSNNAVRSGEILASVLDLRSSNKDAQAAARYAVSGSGA